MGGAHHRRAPPFVIPIMSTLNRVLTTTLGGVVAGVAVLLICVSGTLSAIGLVGATPVVITGSSMAPAIPLGSLAVAVPVSDTPQQGDVVTFTAPNGTYVTHRVTATRPGSPTFIMTKGDANRHPDPHPTSLDRAIGIVTVSVPLVGFVVAMLQTPSGMLALLSFFGSIVTARRALLLRPPPHERRVAAPRTRYAALLVVLALVALQPVLPSHSLLSDSASAGENQFTTGSW